MSGTEGVKPTAFVFGTIHDDPADDPLVYHLESAAERAFSQGMHAQAEALKVMEGDARRYCAQHHYPRAHAYEHVPGGICRVCHLRADHPMHHGEDHRHA